MEAGREKHCFLCFERDRFLRRFEASYGEISDETIGQLLWRQVSHGNMPSPLHVL